MEKKEYVIKGDFECAECDKMIKLKLTLPVKPKVEVVRWSILDLECPHCGEILSPVFAHPLKKLTKIIPLAHYEIDLKELKG